MAYLAYVKRNGKVEAQRWEEWPTVDNHKIVVVGYYELNRMDMHARLNFLVGKYPYEGPKMLTQEK